MTFANICIVVTIPWGLPMEKFRGLFCSFVRSRPAIFTAATLSIVLTRNQNLHDYNLVKHFRADKPEVGIPNYQFANLKNVISALAALYILCQNLYKKLEDSQIELEKSKLFE